MISLVSEVCVRPVFAPTLFYPPSWWAAESERVPAPVRPWSGFSNSDSRGKKCSITSQDHLMSVTKTPSSPKKTRQVVEESLWRLQVRLPDGPNENWATVAAQWESLILRSGASGSGAPAQPCTPPSLCCERVIIEKLQSYQNHSWVWIGLIVFSRVAVILVYFMLSFDHIFGAVAAKKGKALHLVVKRATCVSTSHWMCGHKSKILSITRFVFI